MASLISNLPLPPPYVSQSQKQPLLRNPHKFTLSALAEQRGRVAVVAKASGESSESSLSIAKSVQNVWDSPEDRFAFIGLGFAGVVALWASLNLVTAIDKLPIIPGVFELVGILYSSWFIYRYLLFKSDREELIQIVNKSLADVLGQ